MQQIEAVQNNSKHHAVQDHEAVIPTAFGAIAIRAQDDFLTSIELLGTPQPEKHSAKPFVQDIVQQLKQYLSDPSFHLEAAYAVKGTHYQRRVWQAIADIPSGQTLSYGELAEKVKSGARAVANVCGANQVPLFIPCHRVVARTGLGGFMQGKTHGLTIKQWLLDHEAQAASKQDKQGSEKTAPIKLVQEKMPVKPAAGKLE